MSSDVDLRELAIDRSGPGESGIRSRRHVLTRYVLPLLLMLGFLSLMVWASRDFLFPPKAVTVVPVFSTTADVQPEGTPLFQAAGWIEPRPTPVRVAALAPGVIEKLLVVEDQPVKAGETIAELVKDDAQLLLDGVIADLELRQAELAEAQPALMAATTRFEQPVHLEAALGEAEAALARIETELQNLPFQRRRAEADLEAMQIDYDGKLSARGVVAGVQIDLAKSKAHAAKAMVEELRDRDDALKKEQSALSQRREALRTQLELLADETRAKGEAEARIKAAQARIAQARVAVAEAKLRLDRMTIVAPIDGRVFRLIAHPGTRLGSGITQMAGQDGSTVVTMYRPQALQVRVDVRFEDLPKVALDQRVVIDNAALTSPHTGTVLFISSEADIQKNTLQVKVGIPNPPPVFKPEMLVDVIFLAPKQAERSTKPTQQLKLYVLESFIHEDVEQGGGSYVWLADQSEGRAVKQPIQTGSLGSNGLMEVTRGLTVSSRLISGGSEGLRNGQRITITREDESPATELNPNRSDPADGASRLPAGESHHGTD
jgi:multidrug efflux pump subunit AcrA (membrane-fusion protein)